MTESDSPKPKLRWYQFSLRTLLIVTLVLSVFFGLVGSRIQRARKNRELHAEIQDRGWRAYGVRERPLWQNGILHDPGPVWAVGGDSEFDDSGLMHLKEMTDRRGLYLEGLYLEGTQVTDAGLVNLKDMTGLVMLRLADTQITGSGFVYLKELTNLEDLVLYDTKVTDAGLEHLTGLTNLDWLALGGTQVTDAGLVHLKHLTSLTSLILLDTQVTEEGVKKLQEALPNCEIRH